VMGKLNERQSALYTGTATYLLTSLLIAK